MKKIKILLAALIISLCLCLSCCTAVTVQLPASSLDLFFGNTPAGTNSTPEPASVQSSTSEENTSSDENTETREDVSSTEQTSSAEQSAGTTEAPSTQEKTTESNGEKSKEEIIKLYVDGYNKIAKDAKKIVRTYDYTSQYNDILEINNNSTLEKLAKSLMNSFMKETDERIDTPAADVPPVGLTSIQIAPDKISSAQCSDKGNSYEIVLASTGSDSNWEIDSKPGTGSAGSIGPILEADVVSEAAGDFVKFEGLHMWYGTAKVTATVEKSTGHITALKFYTPCVLHFDKVSAAFLKVSNCSLGLLFQQQYELSY